MRKLALSSVSCAAAIFLVYYLLPVSGLWAIALFCAVISSGCFFLRKRSDYFYRGFLCFLGLTLGLSAFLFHWNRTLRYAEQLDDTDSMLSVRVLEFPESYEHYSRVHVQMEEKPRLGIMLYDYDGMTEELRPGDVISVSARLRRADLRNGERNDSYVSKDIYLTGTLQEIAENRDSRQSLSTFAALCSRRVSDYAASLFSEQCKTFLRSLLLGDKTDFYQDLPLYASMRGAGFMHVVAVSGVQYLLLGFYRIARKPVNWALFGTRQHECRELLRFT